MTPQPGDDGNGGTPPKDDAGTAPGDNEGHPSENHGGTSPADSAGPPPGGNAGTPSDGNGGAPPAPPEFTVSISGAGVVTFGGNQTGDVSVEIVDGKLEFSRGTVKAANKDITVGQLALQAAFPEGVTVVITGLTAGPVNVAQATRIWRDRRLLRLKPESPCRVAKVKFTTWRATRLTCR